MEYGNYAHLMIVFLFVGWHDGCYVLLHHFLKKTRKTPQREIDKAKRELADLQKREDTHGE